MAPSGSDDVVSVAVPVLSSGWVPSCVDPLKNMTFPVGTPEPGVLTVTTAVKFTGEPSARGVRRDCQLRCRVGLRHGYGGPRGGARQVVGVAQIVGSDRRVGRLQLMSY